MAIEKPALRKLLVDALKHAAILHDMDWMDRLAKGEDPEPAYQASLALTAMVKAIEARVSDAPDAATRLDDQLIEILKLTREIAERTKDVDWIAMVDEQIAAIERRKGTWRLKL